jgi:hypothetical protein
MLDKHDAIEEEANIEEITERLKKKDGCSEK